MQKNSSKASSLVGIIMGSPSDLSVMGQAADILESLGIPHEVTIVSAHRTPKRMFDYASNAAKRGMKVIIAGAGGAAHLPGMVASITSLPVIGVPVLSKNSLNGLDALLSIAQMPQGIPVAAVAVNGSLNAGLLAARILALSDTKIARKVQEYQAQMQRKVEHAVKLIARRGHKALGLPA